MADNHKLTGVLKGRIVTGTQNQDHKLLIRFTDGSVMTIKTAGSVNSATTGGAIQGVRQHGTTLTLDMEGGASWAIETAEATSCVMVRDANHALEYAD